MTWGQHLFFHWGAGCGSQRSAWNISAVAKQRFVSQKQSNWLGESGEVYCMRTSEKRPSWEHSLRAYSLPESLSWTGPLGCWPRLSLRGPTWNHLEKVQLYWHRKAAEDTAQCFLQASLSKSSKYLFPEDLVVCSLWLDVCTFLPFHSGCQETQNHWLSTIGMMEAFWLAVTSYALLISFNR